MEKLFGLSDIETSFSRASINRGGEYLRGGFVLKAWFGARGELRGRVSGSGIEPYLVAISVKPAFVGVDIVSSCDCPMKRQCKHGAALALYARERKFKLEGPGDGEEPSVESKTETISLPMAAPVELEVPLPAGVQDWMDRVQSAASVVRTPDPSLKQRIFYKLQVLRSTSGGEIPTVTPVNRNILKDGSFGAETEVKHGSITSHQKPKHWSEQDRQLLEDLLANAPRINWDRTEFRLDQRHGSRILQDLLATGRCVTRDGKLLTLGPARPGVFEWHEDAKKGSATPIVNVQGGGSVISAATPWYIDRTTLQCGPLLCDLSPEVVANLIRTGPIEAEHLSTVRKKLEALGLPKTALPPIGTEIVVRAPDPTPCLSIEFEACEEKWKSWKSPPVIAPVAFAKLTFEYEGRKANETGGDLRLTEAGKVVVLRRNLQAERLTREFLVEQKWREVAYSIWEIPKGRSSSLHMAPSSPNRPFEAIQKSTDFIEKVAPVLISAGWKVEIDDSFRLVPDSDVEWDISLESGDGIDWFQFQLGIKVEGEPFDLRSILDQLFKEKSQHSNQPDDLYVFGLKGRMIKLSRQRLSAILQPLVEIFGGVTEWPEELRMSKADLPQIARFEESTAVADVPWKTTDELKQLNQKFKAFDRLEPLSEPKGFKGELRGYQREGLAWLQFLREYGFAGVLADDMGLGKTVQILSHIQTEKASGRMDRPCLIVAPTSTMPNWKRECERFAPDLKVVVLQGARRSDRFSELKGADIALTTYPLLARDTVHLTKSEYHVIVLDEAQNIKNAATAAARAARDLKGRHRVCLSGTPVENHLGELWSLFQFLMPGFLGSDAVFKKRYRTPIEKLGDASARESLARRIRPFMLRRTKTQVLKELPPKTEIIESIEFDDPQRDLYESIRVAMDEEVRKLIAAQGFDKSRIQILDALLKLRQVCCDPRLVKLPSAQSVKVSAKLDRLMEMLGVLIEEGRRVLVFSQFTSMLDLIELRLKEEKLSWVRISGDTADRDTPVRRFQAGEVALFLISLKAGGTGLNLTAADTVILYDPWWNPAVENQAIDRAHRIGQEKAVAVYKMVASKTIEEKMLEMQARKGDIAKSILTDDAEGIRTLSAEDLRWVLSKD